MMSVTPAGGQRQDDGHDDHDRRPVVHGLPSTTLLILAVSGAVMAIAVSNPDWGLAIGIGIATIGLLITIVTG
jgi:hypothetical protein